MTPRTIARAAALAALLLPFTARAQLIVPPFIQNGGHQNDPLIHDGFLDATLYGADPTGASDSTAAIQNAMNDARDYALVAYLPAGTYVISDTLLGWERLGDPACATNVGNYGVNMPNEPYVNEAAQAPSLVGPPNGARAVLQLANNADGFGDPQNPKPALHMVNLYPDGGIAGYEGQNLPTSVGAFDCLFYAVVRDIDLTLGSGNPGAIGVQFYSAQMSYMENVNVNATGAYAGFQGAPATSDWVNLSVQGGQYGILMDTACGSNSLAGITLSEQTTTGISIAACGSTALTGFDIQESAAQPISVVWSADTGQTVSAAFIDGTIALASGDSPAIGNPNGMNLLVNNVYVQAPGALVQSGGQPAIAGSGADLITAYSYTDTSMPGADWTPATSQNLVDGALGNQEIADVTPGPGTPPSDLVLRHLPGPLPWIADPGVIDATTLGADPTGATDSTAGIQAAINAGTEVFLPRGDYQISGTLTLNADTRLFGVPGMRTGLYGPNWSPSATYLPFVQSANTASGHTYLGDLNFQMPDEVSSASTGYDQSYLGAIDWQAGRSSVVNQIGINLDYDQSDTASAGRDLVHVEANGGGKWYGVQASVIAGYVRAQNPDFRFFLVDGTQAPLTLYGANFEHADTDTFMEVNNGAANVRVFSTKTECNDSWLWAEDSNNVFLTSLNGDWRAGSTPGLLSASSTNVEFALLGWYANESDTTYMVYQTANDGPDAGISYANGVSLFQEGTFDESPFPHCGDDACDGAETASNCPVDCGGASGTSATSGTTSGTAASSTSGTGTTSGTTTSTSSTSSSGANWSACKSSGAPTWANVPSLFIPYTDAVIGSFASNAALSASVQTAWDQTNLYVQVQVTDANAVNNPSLPVYETNAVELYLDGTHSRTPAYDAGDEQLIVSADDRDNLTLGSHSATLADGGYRIDFTIPFAFLGANAGVIGFDVAIDDNPDGGVTRAGQLMWSGDGGAFLDPQQFGSLTLSDTVCGGVVGSTSGTTTGDNTGSSTGSSTGTASSSGTGGASSATTGTASTTGSTMSATGTGCGCGATGDPAAFVLLALPLVWFRRRSRSPSHR